MKRSVYEAALEKEVGYTSTGGYSKFGKTYGIDPGAWCDMFLSVKAKENSGTPIIGWFAWTPSHAEWFKANKKWGKTPKPGAIVFYQWANSDRICHVGYVKAVDGPYIYTIEGNVSAAVQRLKRTTTYVVGYGYPEYAPEAAVAAPPVAKVEIDEMKTPPTVKHGSKGQPVKNAQMLLIAHNYPLNTYGVDSHFGDETHIQIRAFQKAKRLDDDGIVGRLTWQALLDC